MVYVLMVIGFMCYDVQGLGVIMIMYLILYEYGFKDLVSSSYNGYGL